MTETEKWINESLKSLPLLCAEVRRLSEENDTLRASFAKENGNQPPNDPLTLERLRAMDGEPVWVQCLSNEDYSGWIIADLCFNGVAAKYFYAYFDYYGEEWLAYRHKPEGS